MKSKFTAMFTEDFQLDGKLHAHRSKSTGVHMVYCNDKETVEKLYSSLIDRDKDQLTIQHNSVHNIWGIKVSTRHIFERIMKAAEVINNA